MSNLTANLLFIERDPDHYEYKGMLFVKPTKITEKEVLDFSPLAFEDYNRMLNDAVDENVCARTKATLIRKWYREAKAQGRLTYVPPPRLPTLPTSNPIVQPQTKGTNQEPIPAAVAEKDSTIPTSTESGNPELMGGPTVPSETETGATGHHSSLLEDMRNFDPYVNNSVMAGLNETYPGQKYHDVMRQFNQSLTQDQSIDRTIVADSVTNTIRHQSSTPFLTQNNLSEHDARRTEIPAVGSSDVANPNDPQAVSDRNKATFYNIFKDVSRRDARHAKKHYQLGMNPQGITEQRIFEWINHNPENIDFPDSISTVSGSSRSSRVTGKIVDELREEFNYKIEGVGNRIDNRIDILRNEMSQNQLVANQNLKKDITASILAALGERNLLGIPGRPPNPPPPSQAGFPTLPTIPKVGFTRPALSIPPEMIPLMTFNPLVPTTAVAAPATTQVVDPSRRVPFASSNPPVGNGSGPLDTDGNPLGRLFVPNGPNGNGPPSIHPSDAGNDNARRWNDNMTQTDRQPSMFPPSYKPFRPPFLDEKTTSVQDWCKSLKEWLLVNNYTGKAASATVWGQVKTGDQARIRASFEEKYNRELDVCWPAEYLLQIIEWVCISDKPNENAAEQMLKERPQKANETLAEYCDRRLDEIRQHMPHSSLERQNKMVVGGIKDDELRKLMQANMAGKTFPMSSLKAHITNFKFDNLNYRPAISATTMNQQPQRPRFTPNFVEARKFATSWSQQQSYQPESKISSYNQNQNRQSAWGSGIQQQSNQNHNQPQNNSQYNGSRLQQSKPPQPSGQNGPKTGNGNRGTGRQVIKTVRKSATGVNSTSNSQGNEGGAERKGDFPTPELNLLMAWEAFKTTLTPEDEDDDEDQVHDEETEISDTVSEGQ